MALLLATSALALLAPMAPSTRHSALTMSLLKEQTATRAGTKPFRPRLAAPNWLRTVVSRVASKIPRRRLSKRAAIQDALLTAGLWKRTLAVPVPAVAERTHNLGELEWEQRLLPCTTAELCAAAHSRSPLEGTWEDRLVPSVAEAFAGRPRSLDDFEAWLLPTLGSGRSVTGDADCWEDELLPPLPTATAPQRSLDESGWEELLP